MPKKKKVKINKQKVLKASKTMYKNLKTLYDMYEVAGKDLRAKRAPEHVYFPIFRAQDAINDAIRHLREVIGALS